MFAYFFPLIGAIIADTYLGKFRTIFFLSLIYAAGNVLLSVSSTPALGLPQRPSSLLGLLLIAVGTGGIKPCVSAFGGDQFKLPDQAKQLAQFFSIFYFSINAGSLISTYITPILRHDVHCFGADTCFPLAFGVPAVLMIVSLVIFLLGKKLYIMKKPQGNIIVDVTKCIFHALMMKTRSKDNKKEHWLDYASDKYSPVLISDTKAVLQILLLFIPLPVFWALYDQQGSRWTFQATRMDGRLGPFTIKPDQLQVINPLLILAFIPIFESIAYPGLAKLNLLKRPLQRLSTGGMLAALAFVVSAILEFKLEGTYAVLPDAGESQLRIFNGLSCSINIHSSVNSVNGIIPQLSVLEANHIETYGIRNFTVNLSIDKSCSQYSTQSWSDTIFVSEKQAKSYFIGGNVSPVMYAVPGYDDIQKLDNANAKVRVLYNLPPDQKTLKLVNNDYNELFDLEGSATLITVNYSTSFREVNEVGRFDAFIGSSKVNADIDIQPGGVYALIIGDKNYAGKLLTISPPNSIHMLWLLPQYIIVTAAEIMFSITGLEFSFTQAPVSMKSLLSASWLLTVSFGNLIVVIVSEAKFFKSQAHEFLLFAALMFVDMLIFIIIALRYKYYTPVQTEKASHQNDVANGLEFTQQNG